MEKHKRSSTLTAFFTVLLTISLTAAACGTSEPETIPNQEVSVAPDDSVEPTTALTQPDTTKEPTTVPATPEVTAKPTVAPAKPEVTTAPTTTPVEPDLPSESVTVPAPVFSKDGGFYDDAFMLTLSATDDDKIYYTTDGTDPRTSSTATLYTKVISIYNNTSNPNVFSAVKDIAIAGYNPPKEKVDKGIVIRAVSKNADGEYSAVVANSYFIDKTASYYTDMKVISMVTDGDYLFNKDTGRYMVGSNYYKWLKSDEFVSLHSGDVLNPTNYNEDGRETEFPVTLQVFEEGKSVYTIDVGARISGNWSRAANQKSFRFYARKEYGSGKLNYAFFDGLSDINGTLIEKFDKITLRNSGNDNQTLHFRDALLQDLVRDLAPDIMAAEPCILFLNGEFWGFYMIREKTDGDYIEAHYGIDEKQVTVLKNGGVESGNEEDLEAFREFCSWAVSADMTQNANYEKFCATINIQDFMDFMTIQTYLNNNDFANGGMNNWQVWRSNEINPYIPEADGKWRVILSDLDFTTGLYHGTETAYDYDSLNKNYAPGDFDMPGMLRNLCTNETFCQMFYDNYIHIMETTFAPSVVAAKTDAYLKAYGDAVKATFFRFDTAWAAYNLENEVEFFKNYFRTRPSYAKRYLDKYCGVESEPTTNDDANLVPATDTWNYYGDATFTANAEENSFTVEVPKAAAYVWNIQSQAEDILLEKGCTYRVSFDASCTSTVSFDIGINRFDGTDYPNCWWVSTKLTPELTNYEFYFTMNHNTYSDWKLCFNYGLGKGTFVVKNVSLSKVEN